MPPSRSLLQYSCRGFICHSCVSKLLRPRRPPWLSRNIASGGQNPKKDPLRSKNGAGKIDDPDIKYFAETSDGGREEIDPDPHAAVVRSLDERIAQLEKQLADAKAGKMMLTVEQQEIQEQLNMLTDEEREELLNVVGKVTDSLNQDLDTHHAYNFEMKYDDLPKAIQIQTFLRTATTAALGNDFKPAQRLTLWKQYTMIRKVFRSSADRVPADIWTFLWTVFAKTALANPERLSRLKTLAEDIEHAGIALSDSQMIIFLEAWYLHGQRNSAIDRWRSLVGTLGQENSKVFRQFWEGGVKMLALNGSPQEATNAAVALFKGAPDADARAVIPIIESWVASNDPQKSQKAWTIYRKLRSALSGTMQLKDYDTVAAIFLRADLPGLALGVFRDMMLSGDQKGQASTIDIKQLFANMTPDSSDKMEDVKHLDIEGSQRRKDVDWTAFEALAYLPPKIRNKFFFGKWIKKLLGEKDIPGALQVIRVMHSYQIRPYAIQLNGVVGALLRSGTVRGIAAGEDIAWDMMNARYRFLAAQERMRMPALEGSLRPVLSTGKNDFSLAVGNHQITPQATTETLALLIETYQIRGFKHHINNLWNMVKKLQLRPTTWILNQFLMAYHKFHDYDSVRKIYSECVVSYHVKPDLDTIKWLWLFMQQRRNQKGPYTATQESTRKLFARTMKHLPRSITTDTEKIVMSEIYDLVILCFGYVDDQVGTAIAIQALHQRLGLYPSDTNLRKIVAQLAASEGHMKSPSRPVRFQRPARSRRSEISAMLQHVMKQRAGELKSQGIDLDTADEKIKGKEKVFVLTKLLKSLFDAKIEGLVARKENSGVQDESVELKRRTMSEAIQNEVGRDVAAEMGVPLIRPWED